MDKTSVYIRVDASAEIGFGHFIRCTALANMLKRDFNIHFFSKKLPENLLEDTIEKGFRITQISDENQFFLKLTGKEIIVLDDYNFDISYQKKIKSSGCKLVCIDDIHDRTFFADLIINHAPSIVPDDYDAQGYTQFALGLKYALLRPAFLKASKNIPKVQSNELFICFGGSDHFNYTQLILEIVLSKAENLFSKINIVIGEAYNHEKRIRQIGSKSDKVKVYRSLTEDEMIKIMSHSGYAIVPCSGILLESLALGLNVISGMYAENQKLIYENFKESGVFRDAGHFEKDRIVKALYEVKAQNNTNQLLIDGDSGNRLLKFFKLLKDESHIKLRRARASDLEQTFSWATNPKIRKHSFNNKSITLEEHTNWFLNKIDHPESCYFYIAEIDEQPIGSIRFDVKNDEAIISFLVDPKYHGKGYGYILLKKGYQALIRDSGDINIVIGYVLAENIASINSFNKLGYSSLAENEGKRYKFSKKIKH